MVFLGVRSMFGAVLYGGPKQGTTTLTAYDIEHRNPNSVVCSSGLYWVMDQTLWPAASTTATCLRGLRSEGKCATISYQL